MIQNNTWDGFSKYYEPSFVDFEDVEEVTLSINAARKALYELTIVLADFEKDYRKAQYSYDVQLRKAILESSRSNAVDRKLDGEIQCQASETKVIVTKTKVDEIRRAMECVRQELQALQTISNNLRQQMKVL